MTPEQIVDEVIAHILEKYGEWGDFCLGNEPTLKDDLMKRIADAMREPREPR